MPVHGHIPEAEAGQRTLIAIGVFGGISVFLSSVFAFKKDGRSC